MSNPELDKNIKFNNPIWGIPPLLREEREEYTNNTNKNNTNKNNANISFSVNTNSTNVSEKINNGESNLKTIEVINSEVINKSNNINLNNLYTLNLPNHNRINISDISIKINENICPYIIPPYITQYNTKNKNLSIVLNNYYNTSLNPILIQIKPAVTYDGNYPVVVGRANIGNPLNIKNNIQENSKLNNTIKINKNKDSNNFKKFKIFNKIKAKKDSETSVISLYVGNKVISLVLKFIPNKKINKIKQDK